MSDAVPIINWLRYDDRLTTSGQPNEAQLGALAALGIRHVINLGLHTHEQALADECASVEGQGMSYTHIPVAFDAPSEDDFSSFCSAMAAVGTAPTHVHCIMNWRVTAFLYRYQRDVLRLAEPMARAQMERIWNPAAGGDDPRFSAWANIIAQR